MFGCQTPDVEVADEHVVAAKRLRGEHACDVRGQDLTRRQSGCEAGQSSAGVQQDSATH